MTASISRMIKANGLAFAIDEAGEGDAVALCLHGFPESRISWRHQLPVLAQAGWRAVAPDLRGYGETDRPCGRDAYALGILAQDVAALFDVLGARRRLLIGHDWGALIAWAFASWHTRPLDGLVAMNVPHPAVFRGVLRHSWEQRLRSWYVAAFQLPWLPEAVLTAGGARGVARAIQGTLVDRSAIAPEVLEVYRRNAMKPGAMTAMINYYRANAASLGRSRTWPTITVPTLLIWGEADTALGLELTQGYEPYVADLTLERLPGVSHWVQQEAPDAVNARLLAWLQRTGLGQGRC